jgi:hypothetical protein
LPFKTFVSNEILTASDVNSQIMNQQIMVFADASARDSALGSPTEGMFSFLKDTDTLTYYDGTSWEDF